MLPRARWAVITGKPPCRESYSMPTSPSGGPRGWASSVHRSPPTGEYRLDVHDGRPVEDFEIPHEHPGSFDRGDACPVQPDRIRPVLRPGAEHTHLGVSRVVARVNGKHVAA